MPTVDVSTSISAFEAAQTTLASADSAQAAAQAKFDAAQVTLTTAASDDISAVKSYNATIDALVAALQTAKR